MTAQAQLRAGSHAALKLKPMQRLDLQKTRSNIHTPALRNTPTAAPCRAARMVGQAVSPQRRLDSSMNTATPSSLSASYTWSTNITFLLPSVAEEHRHGEVQSAASSRQPGAIFGWPSKQHEKSSLRKRGAPDRAGSHVRAKLLRKATARGALLRA